LKHLPQCSSSRFHSVEPDSWLDATGCHQKTDFIKTACHIAWFVRIGAHGHGDAPGADLFQVESEERVTAGVAFCEEQGV